MKTAQLQIRLTPEQKARLRQRAAGAGQDLSSFVLSRVLPPLADRFEAVLRALRQGGAPDSFSLAELNDLLAADAITLNTALTKANHPRLINAAPRGKVQNCIVVRQA